MKSIAIGTLFLAAASATAETCGISGYDNSGHDCAGVPAYNIDIEATTPALCSALCKSESTCHSFAVGNKHCLLYSVPTKDNFTPGATKGPDRSPYYFYDVSCKITSPSPPISHQHS